MSDNGLKITKVGLPLMKMEELIDYINISDNVEVEQTRNVGILRSEEVARIATEEEGNPELDKSTVLNALNLNGVKAEDYLSKEEAIDLRKFAKDVSTTHAEEIRCLRDELYQTREQLVRHGVVEDNRLYNGFYDIFTNDRIKYMDNTYFLTENIAQGSNILKIANTSDFFVGEYIAVIKKSAEEENNSTPKDITVNVVKVTKVEEDQITINKKLSTSSIEDIAIRKTAGEYDEGTFVFAKVKRDVLTGSEMHSTFLDDKYVTEVPIAKSKTGLGVSFRVDQKITGALKKFKVVARPVNGRERQGFQGLSCYVIKDTPENRRIFTTIDKVKNIERETGKQIIIAEANKSKTKYINGFLVFDFGRDGSYPKIYNSGKENHLFIFTDENADKDTHWTIEYATTNVDKELEDLHKHNVSYFYDPAGSEDKNTLTTPEYLDNREMRFSLTTEAIKDKSYIPYKEGLYSRELRLPKDISGTTVRVALRAAREGNLKVKSDSFIIGKGGDKIEEGSNMAPISVEADRGIFSSVPANNSGYYGIEKNDKVIVGESIYKIEGINNNEMYIINEDEEFKEIKKGSMFHRCGYDISIRGYKYNIVIDENGKPIKELDEDSEVIIPLKYAYSVEDEDHSDKMATNRMVFEAEFFDEEDVILKDYQYFELQVRWKSNFDFNKEKSKIESISDYALFESLIGRIKECVVSFTKSVYTELEDKISIE